MRRRSSPAAFRVKVMAAIRSMGTGCSPADGASISTRRSTRMVVLPVPAPASMSTLRRRSFRAASRWGWSGAGLRPSRILVALLRRFQIAETRQHPSRVAQDLFGAPGRVVAADGAESAVGAVVGVRGPREVALGQKAAGHGEPLAGGRSQHAVEIIPPGALLGAAANIGVGGGHAAWDAPAGGQLARHQAID